jgi:hypothetical protein
LLQFLTDKTLGVSVASRGDRTTDLIQDVALGDLVQRALENLPLEILSHDSDTSAARDTALNALAVAKLSQVHAKFKPETTGMTHE